MEQLILILVIGLISLVNWLIQKSAEAREKRKLERQTDRMDRGGVEEETAYHRSAPEPAPNRDESMRRLMEALGLPEEAPEPQPIEPRRRTFVDEPPPLPEPVYSPEPPPRMIRRVTEVQIPVVPPALPKTTPVYSAGKKKAVTTPEVQPVSRARALLSRPGSLKDAIVLSEILGKPKAYDL